MNDEELDRYVLSDGLRELDVQIDKLKSWIARERWSEAYIKVAPTIRLLRGLRRVIESLERRK